MDFLQVKELIKIVNESKLMDFELSMDNVNISMSKNSEKISKEKTKEPKSNFEMQIPVNEPITIIPEEKVEIKEGTFINSPIVGTFYQSASPEKPAFVKVGDKVKAGDVLCIVEAMKIMNELTAKKAGVIAEILVENESLVEFGQPLFRIIEEGV